jgi:hypothetical protein
MLSAFFVYGSVVNNNITITVHSMRNSKLNAKGHKILLIHNFQQLWQSITFFPQNILLCVKYYKRSILSLANRSQKCAWGGGREGIVTAKLEVKKLLLKSIPSSINTFSKCLSTRLSSPEIYLINVAAN